MFHATGHHHRLRDLRAGDPALRGILELPPAKLAALKRDMIHAIINARSRAFVSPAYDHHWTNLASLLRLGRSSGSMKEGFGSWACNALHRHHRRPEIGPEAHQVLLRRLLRRHRPVHFESLPDAVRHGPRELTWLRRGWEEQTARMRLPLVTREVLVRSGAIGRRCGRNAFAMPGVRRDGTPVTVQVHGCFVERIRGPQPRAERALPAPSF